MAKPKIERTINVPIDILKELLTDSEVRMIKQRYQILQLLDEGISIRSIATQLKIGTDTVVRLARLAERKGLLKSGRRVASRSKSITSPASHTSWIFGKSE